MSNYDPNRIDPDLDRPNVRDRYDDASGFNWNWIIGGLAAIVVLFVALSFFGRSGDQTTATNDRPAATTGQSTSAPASPTQSSSPNPAPTTPNMSPSNIDRQNPPAAPQRQ